MSIRPIRPACWLTLRAASHCRIRGGFASAGRSTARGDSGEFHPDATETAIQASDPATTRGWADGPTVGRAVADGVGAALAVGAWLAGAAELDGEAALDADAPGDDPSGGGLARSVAGAEAGG